MSFQQHLKDAIAINKQRLPYYKKQTKGQSVNLSRVLIGLEYLALPIAAYFERQAKPFNTLGIAIVQDDFVAMNVAEETRCPVFQAELSATLLQQLRQLQKNKSAELTMLAQQNNHLKNHYESAKAYLFDLSNIEQEHRVHLSMTKHIFESYAFIAQNGLVYAKNSGGETLELSKRLLSLHRRLFRYTLYFDRAANRCHQMGVGILYNDLPTIELL